MTVNVPGPTYVETTMKLTITAWAAGAAFLLATGCCGPRYSQTRWEYRVVSHDSIGYDWGGQLNTDAKDGWEVVSIEYIEKLDRLQVVLKRPKP
jgi:hypothetical protein